MPATIRALYSYPVKGCRANDLKTAVVNCFGIENDRQLMVLQEGAMVNQKLMPGLARIAISRQGANELTFSAEGHADLRHSISKAGKPFDGDFYGSPAAVVDQGDAINDWFSTVLGTPLQVVASAATFRRDLPPELPTELFGELNGIEQQSFADISPLLLTTQASLDELNTHFIETLPMDRFRPNIVLDGTLPWEEDGIRQIHIGELVLKRQAHCERCAVTCTDQRTGKRYGEPLRTLREIRTVEKAYANGIAFGAYFTVEGEGQIAVGDKAVIDYGS